MNETKTTKKEELYNEIRELLENDNDIFTEAIEELDSWNGYLGDDRYFGMYDFDELMQGKTPSEIAQEVWNGGFNPNDDYFRFTIYGVESDCYKDYSDYLDDYFIDELINCYPHLCINSDLEALLEDYDYADDFDEEEEEEEEER